MKVTRIVDHWSTLTRRWVQQVHPADASPELEAWREWRSTGGMKAEELPQPGTYRYHVRFIKAVTAATAAEEPAVR